jgi:hypothetical protein
MTFICDFETLTTEEKGGTTFRSSTDEILRHLLGITKLDKKTNVLGKKQEQKL